MKRLTKQQRLLAAGLTLALGIWAVDTLTGKKAGPVRAQAAQATTPPPAAAVDWEQVNTLVARLTEQRYVSVAPELDQTSRDLFAPSAAMESSLAPVEPVIEPNAPAIQEAAIADFRDRHELSGVVIGRHPLAIVDGHVLRPGSELDGHRLVELQRDYVVFQAAQTGTRVTLKLIPRTGKPAAPQP